MWRPGPAGTPEIALVHRPRYDDWSLPKGKLEPGEHPLAGAVREVREEAGLVIQVGRPLPTLRYEAFGRPKEVRYWAARALGGDFVPNDEVDALAWLEADAALARLSRPLDAEVVAAFAAGPVHTTALVVLRHGATVPRSQWRGPDSQRPCSAKGLAQAQALVPLLVAYNPRRLFSSDSRRCLQSVEPYAAAAGVQVTALHGLSEEASREEEAAARAEVLAAALEGEDVLVCTHRPVLPPLFEAAAAATGAPVPASPLRKAEVVIDHLYGGRAVDSERHRP